jgi:predicted transport protein
MKKRKNIELRTRVTLEFKNKYMEYCQKHNFVMSGRFRALIEKDMRGEIK